MLILAKVIERLQLDTPSLQLDIVRAVFGTGFPQHHRYMFLLVYIPDRICKRASAKNRCTC